MLRRELIKRLNELGYTMIRDEGKHTVFQKPGKRIELVPHGRKINDFTANGILKRAER